jgi:hypothetical protein
MPRQNHKPKLQKPPPHRPEDTTTTTAITTITATTTVIVIEGIITRGSTTPKDSITVRATTTIGGMKRARSQEKRGNPGQMGGVDLLLHNEHQVSSLGDGEV